MEYSEWVLAGGRSESDEEVKAPCSSYHLGEPFLESRLSQQLFCPSGEWSGTVPTGSIPCTRQSVRHSSTGSRRSGQVLALQVMACYVSPCTAMESPSRSTSHRSERPVHQYVIRTTSLLYSFTCSCVSTRSDGRIVRQASTEQATAIRGKLITPWSVQPKTSLAFPTFIPAFIQPHPLDPLRLPSLARDNPTPNSVIACARAIAHQTPASP